MLGVAVVFILSWIILWLTSKEHLTVLGIIPNRRQLAECIGAFLLTALVGVAHFIWQAHYKEITYIVNPDYSVMKGLMGIWWTMRGVLFEELIFRGVILYLLIRKIGIVRACFIDALVFGIYHWFSYEMFGQIVPMIYVLFVTGAGGWMFAYAFAKTKSLFAPFGLHMGWNLVSIVIFSAGPLGVQLLVPDGDPVELGGWTTLLFFLFQIIVAPGIVTWYLVKRYRNTSEDENSSIHRSEI